MVLAPVDALLGPGDPVDSAGAVRMFSPTELDLLFAIAGPAAHEPGLSPGA